MELAISEGSNGFDKVMLYLRHHVDFMVGERGPIAIMSEIPSLKPTHREEVLELSRRHSAAFGRVAKKSAFPLLRRLMSSRSFVDLALVLSLILDYFNLH